MKNLVATSAKLRPLGYAVVAIAGMFLGSPQHADAQWSTAHEQFYLPGKFNWTFRNTYPAADRLFNAFDYGHAILYEKLYNKPEADPSLLEVGEYDFITKKLLVSPPRLPLEEAAIEVAYAKLAPEAKMMFDWAHLLHRQVYDVLASESMPQVAKDAKVEELVRYYKTRPELAFSSVPKNMDLMEGQPYSLAFRQRYPKFNGLIWGYHWLQVGLYEPLMVGTTLEERQAGVSAAVTRFKQMLEDAPEHMPRIMPMTAAVAPTFAKRYPEAAIIFDNLHSMHDVVSDILANPGVPRNQKRAEILKAASRYRDATSFVMTRAEWMDMATMMGVENMGGPAIGFLAAWPAATIERGTPMAKAMQSMAGMDHARMPSMKPDSAKAASSSGMAGMRHGADSSAMTESMMTAFMRLTGDSVVRKRIVADTGLRRAMELIIEQMPAEHRPHMLMMMPPAQTPDIKPPTSKATPVTRKSLPASTTPKVTRKSTPSTTKVVPRTTAPTKKATPKPAATKVAAPAATKKADPMAGMDHSRMPGMTMPKKPDTTKAATKRPPAV